MAMVRDGDIEIKCPHCGATQRPGAFDVNMTYLHKNQYSARIRLFCKLCDQWTDVTSKDGKVSFNIIQQPKHSRLEALVIGRLQAAIKEIETVRSEHLELMGNAHDEMEWRAHQNRQAGVFDALYILNRIVRDIESAVQGMELQPKKETVRS